MRISCVCNDLAECDRAFLYDLAARSTSVALSGMLPGAAAPPTRTTRPRSTRDRARQQTPGRTLARYRARKRCRISTDGHKDCPPEDQAGRL